MDPCGRGRTGDESGPERPDSSRFKIDGCCRKGRQHPDDDRRQDAVRRDFLGLLVQALPEGTRRADRSRARLGRGFPPAHLRRERGRQPRPVPRQVDGRGRRLARDGAL